MKIPDSFRYFSNSEMKQDSFVDLLNKWVDKKMYLTSGGWIKRHKRWIPYFYKLNKYTL